MKARIGAHVSSTDPVAEAQARETSVIQIFLGDPQSYKGPRFENAGGADALRTDAAAAGVEVDTARFWNAGQQPEGRGEESHCLLMAMAMNQNRRRPWFQRQRQSAAAPLSFEVFLEQHGGIADYLRLPALVAAK